MHGVHGEHRAGGDQPGRQQDRLAAQPLGRAARGCVGGDQIAQDEQALDGQDRGPRGGDGAGNNAGAHGDRQFYQIAELLLQARYDSWVTPDLDRIPRTALPPGTLAVIFSPLLDPRGLAALTDLRRRGFPLIVVDTLRDEPPPVARPADAGLALRLWRLDRAATRSALRALGVPVLPWTEDAELDSVLAPLRQPPGGARRPAVRS